MEKKSERLEVRLGYQEKQDFSEACENQGDTPSGAIRRFINGYVRRSDTDVLSSAWRGAVKRRGWRSIIFIILFVAIAAVVLWATQQKPFVSNEAIFSARDVNNDGYLNVTELDEWADALLKVMDVDDSGGITPDEFVPKGYMAYILAGPKDDPAQKFIPRDGEYVAALKFDIQKEYIIIERHEIIEKAIYLSGGIQLENLDRIVLWHEGGEVTVLNGPAGMGVKLGSTD